MDNKNLLCPICQTGIDMLRLDEYEPMCPYIEYNSGKICCMFTPLKNEENQ